MTIWDQDLFLRWRNGPPVESLDWRLLIDEIQELRNAADAEADTMLRLEKEVENLEARLRYRDEEINDLEIQVETLREFAGAPV